MSIRRKLILDREAYTERRAIMELNGIDGVNAAREAADIAYGTRFGRVCTAAANGDWSLAEIWLAEIRERFGTKDANDVLGEIFDTFA